MPAFGGLSGHYAVLTAQVQPPAQRRQLLGGARAGGHDPLTVVPVTPS
jgi:hypothetical protein